MHYSFPSRILLFTLSGLVSFSDAYATPDRSRNWVERHPINAPQRHLYARPSAASAPPVTTPASRIAPAALPQKIIQQKITTASPPLPLATASPPLPLASSNPPPPAPRPLVTTPTTYPPSPKANAWEGYVPRHLRNQKRPAINAQLYTGYRIDDVEATVAGNGLEKLYESKYNNIGMAEIGAEADYTHRSGTLSGAYLEGKASYAKAFSGDYSDASFAREIPTENGELVQGLFEANRVVGDSDKSDAKDVRAAIGYEIYRVQDTWITPIIGYSYQTLNIKTSNVTIDLPRGGYADDGSFYVIQNPEVIPVGQSIDLNGSYNTSWSSPFLGIIGGYENKKHKIIARGELHYASFEGDGTENFEDETVTLTQSGNGFGFSLAADYTYAVNDWFGIMAGASYRMFSISDGDNTVLFADGSNRIGATSLDSVDWTTQLYRIGARINF
jgi:hypothetical protein